MGAGCCCALRDASEEQQNPQTPQRPPPYGMSPRGDDEAPDSDAESPNSCNTYCTPNSTEVAHPPTAARLQGQGHNGVAGQVPDDAMSSLSTWYDAPEVSAQGAHSDPLASTAGSFSTWFADGQPIPDGRTDKTEVHAIAATVNAWYTAPELHEQEKPLTPRNGQASCLSTWYGDGKPEPDNMTDQTTKHFIGTTRLHPQD